jgi:hypothetical protein
MLGTQLRYALASHVFVCLQGEHVVFLDVRKDRYFALEAAATRGLASLVSRWPVPPEDPARESAEGAAVPALSVLLQKGLLSNGDNSGKRASPPTVGPPASELVSDADDDTPALTGRALWRFTAAAVTASLALRFAKLERVLARVRNRNETRRPSALPPDREHARQLVHIFATLRPFFFTSREQCLFEALALSEFLAKYGIFPSWTFGVQARPFAAHCWLQQDGVVFNDTVDHVSQYTPILCV